VNQYMVDVSLPEFPDEAFFSKIPEQRTLINRLLEERVVQSYALSADRTKLWIVIRAQSDSEAFDILATFPLYDYFRFDIYELAFHNKATVRSTLFSMN